MKAEKNNGKCETFFIREDFQKFSVESAIIRGYGIGIKGMITKFDIIRYLNDFYKGDTEYCKKINDIYYLLDMWNEWQQITDNTKPKRMKI